MRRNLLGSGKLIGISTHSPDQAKVAEAGGADYIGFGPIFRTSTKDAGPVQGIEKISAIKRIVSVPVIAIGGITLANVGEAVIVPEQMALQLYHRSFPRRIGKSLPWR